MTLIICCVIILSSNHAFNRRAASDESAVQSAHKGFVPRVGGIAIFISMLGLIPLLSFGFIPISVVFDLNTKNVFLLIVTACPVLVVGVLEDLGYPMTPKRRLLASVASGFLVLMFLNPGSLN